MLKMREDFTPFFNFIIIKKSNRTSLNALDYIEALF